MLRICRQPFQLAVLSKATQSLASHTSSQNQLLRLSVHLRTISVSSHPCRQVAKDNNGNRNTLTANRERADVSTDVRPLGERVKENAKTASYLGVILLGVTVTGGLIFAILRELWSSSSPNSVYSAALERCINDPRIQDTLGAPIKGFGEESSRRRRTHVAHSVFERNGVKHMRMQFYVQGIRNKATVHLEMKENSAGTFEYRYLFAQLDNYPRNTIVLEDNRAQSETSASAPPQPLSIL